MKILITGGAGFLGAHLARRLLDQGHRVVLLDDFSRGVHDDTLSDLVDRGAESRTRDLLEDGALEGIERDFDTIFHLAAVVGVAHVLRAPFRVLRDNVDMLCTVLEAARRQDRLERLVYLSTSEVYAGTLRHFDLPIPTPEETPLALTPLEHPRTSYMLSKIYGEALCLHAGVPFTTVRPHNVYGPRMGAAHVIPELLRRAWDAPPDGSLEVASLDHSRTFCYVDDAVDLLIGLSRAKDSLGETFNLGSTDRETTIRELAELVCRVVGKNLRITSGGDGPGSPRRRRPDLARTLAVVPHRDFVDLEDGVRRTFDWYRDRVFDGESISAR